MLTREQLEINAHSAPETKVPEQPNRPADRHRPKSSTMERVLTLRRPRAARGAGASSYFAETSQAFRREELMPTLRRLIGQ